MKKKLVPGKWYTMRTRDFADVYTKDKEKATKMQYVEGYKYFARFRRKSGWMECFTYQDLEGRIIYE